MWFVKKGDAMKKCWCGNSDLTEYSHEYYKCEKCKTLISGYDLENSIYDTENEDRDLYGKNYWEVSMTRTAGKNTLSEVVDMYLTERVIYWLKYVLKYVKLGADVAEVGCGLGQLQYVLKNLGYKQLAFELSREVCNYMEQNLGVSTHCGTFEESTGIYDAVLAFDLFEHLLQPEAFIDKCNESLREGGVLCMQTPNFNPDWSYDDMIQNAARFKEQLKAEQHVFLYSKESITALLEGKGYKYIQFEPAFFGENYDMFFLASKEPIRENSPEEIDGYLNSVPAGRIVKALISLFDKNAELEKKYLQADEDRTVRLGKMEELGEMLRQKEADSQSRYVQLGQMDQLFRESEINRAVQHEQIEKLTDMLRESEADRTARQEQIEKLTDMLRESEADRAARQEQIEKLNELLQSSEAEKTAVQEQVEKMSDMLRESEADRTARQEQIDELNGLLQDSEADKVSVREQLEKMSGMLRESEADRTARQEQIEKLRELLIESEADRAARLQQINQLSELLRESEADRAARFEQIQELTRIINENNGMKGVTE